MVVPLAFNRPMAPPTVGLQCGRRIAVIKPAVPAKYGEGCKLRKVILLRAPGERASPAGKERRPVPPSPSANEWAAAARRAQAEPAHHRR
jgi:hypothetical protein